MVFHTNLVILLVTFVAVAMSLQEDCGENYYGTCDPGPGCFNWDPNKEQFRCLPRDGNVGFLKGNLGGSLCSVQRRIDTFPKLC